MIVEATFRTLCGCEQQRAIEVDQSFGFGYQYEVMLIDPRESVGNVRKASPRTTYSIRCFEVLEWDRFKGQAVLVEKGE